MANDHIIPRFILKGYALNSSVRPENQKIMIMDASTLTTKVVKIANAYAVENFNSEVTEKFLANKYESDVAKIFQKIKKSAESDEKSIEINSLEYKLLFRFFIIMWRRNNLHVNTARNLANQMESVMKSVLGETGYKSALKEEYRNTAVDEIFQEREEQITKSFYDKVIPETTDHDPTVLKTISNYTIKIVHNKSKIHFTLHNSYGTLKYLLPKGVYEASANEIPIIILEPISNNLCFCLEYSESVDLAKEKHMIPIEVVDSEEKVEKNFIDGYVNNKATSYVVDETNLEVVKKYAIQKNNIKDKVTSTTKPNETLINVIEESFREAITNPYADMKIGRNELCPCGSGIKFKKCCLKKFSYTK